MRGTNNAGVTRHSGPAAGSTIRVALVDRERLLSETLAIWLQSFEPQLRVVTMVDDWESLSHPPQTRVDVIVVCLDCHHDGSLPGWVRSAVNAGTQVLALATQPVPWVLRSILPAGANGFVPKTDPPQTLAAAIRAVARGSSHLSRDVTATVVRSSLPKLSFQERRVMVRYAAGFTVGEVAAELGITEETAKSYLKRIRQKYRSAGINVSTKVDLHRQAIREGLHDDLPDRQSTSS